MKNSNSTESIARDRPRPKSICKGPVPDCDMAKVLADAVRKHEEKSTEAAEVCQYCASTFTLFKKRQNCSLCKSDFCKNCARFMMEVPHLGPGEHRVCITCKEKPAQMIQNSIDRRSSESVSTSMSESAASPSGRRLSVSELIAKREADAAANAGLQPTGETVSPKVSKKPSNKTKPSTTKSPKSTSKKLAPASARRPSKPKFTIVSTKDKGTKSSSPKKKGSGKKTPQSASPGVKTPSSAPTSAPQSARRPSVKAKKKASTTKGTVKKSSKTKKTRKKCKGEAREADSSERPSPSAVAESDTADTQPPGADRRPEEQSADRPSSEGQPPEGHSTTTHSNDANADLADRKSDHEGMEGAPSEMKVVVEDEVSSSDTFGSSSEDSGVEGDDVVRLGALPGVKRGSLPLSETGTQLSITSDAVKRRSDLLTASVKKRDMTRHLHAGTVGSSQLKAPRIHKKKKKVGRIRRASTFAGDAFKQGLFNKRQSIHTTRENTKKLQVLAQRGDTGETPEQRAERMRTQVIIEILTTEESYVSSLEALVEVFILPLVGPGLAANPPWLEKKDIETIFSNIRTIWQLNANFLKDIHDRLDPLLQKYSNVLDGGEGHIRELYKATADIEVGDLFTSFAPFFKLYSMYVNNHESCTNFLTRTVPQSRRYERFTLFLERAREDARCKGQSLQSYLIMPIQRIPRYRLMIQELLKYTRAGHKDQQPLSKALGTIQDVASHINQAVFIQQNNMRILNLQDQFLGNVCLIAPGRLLVKQGTLTKLGRRKNQRYGFFLFNDMLAYGASYLAPNGWRYKLHREVPINDTFAVEDIADSEIYAHQSERTKQKNRFQISTHEKSFVVFADTYEDKLAWLHSMRETIREREAALNRDKGKKKKAVVLEQYHWKSVCFVCHQQCSIMNRRHCKKCGHVVHQDCAKTKMILQGTHEKTLKRVCNKCVKEIREERSRELAIPAPAVPSPMKVEEQKTPVKGRTRRSYTTFSPVRGPAGTNPVSLLPPQLPERPRESLVARALLDLDSKKPGAHKRSQTVLPSRSEELLAKPSMYSRAVFAFEPTGPRQLRLEAGDVIHVLGPEGSKGDWLRGIVRGYEGIFPTNYTKATECPLVRVKQRFKAETEREINLQAGDRLFVDKMDNTGWWHGRDLKDHSKLGWFPASWVEPSPMQLPFSSLFDGTPWPEYYLLPPSRIAPPLPGQKRPPLPPKSPTRNDMGKRSSKRPSIELKSIDKRSSINPPQISPKPNFDLRKYLSGDLTPTSLTRSRSLTTFPADSRPPPTPPRPSSVRNSPRASAGKPPVAGEHARPPLPSRRVSLPASAPENKVIESRRQSLPMSKGDLPATRMKPGRDAEEASLQYQSSFFLEDPMLEM